MPSSICNSRVAAAVLAAGRSSRFPGDKLLHPFMGRPLAAHIADTLSQLDTAFRLAVCPPALGRVELFRARGFEIVINATPERGMASSLALAAQRAAELEAEKLVICLADMPFVTDGHLTRLLDLVGDLPAATRVEGHVSPPAAFPRHMFAQLAELTGDHGARRLLAAATLLEAPPGLARDFDTIEDFG